MPDIKLDLTTGDVAIINGDFALTREDNGEATRQRLHIRLRQWTGDWFLDTREGLPYREEILKKNPDLARVEALLKTRILETRGVRRLMSYNQTHRRADRELDVAFRVEDEFGNVLDVKEVLTA